MHSNRLNPKVCTEMVETGVDDFGRVMYTRCDKPKTPDMGMCWECRDAAIRKTKPARDSWSFCRACSEPVEARKLMVDGVCKDCKKAGREPVVWYSEGKK